MSDNKEDLDLPEAEDENIQTNVVQYSLKGIKGIFDALIPMHKKPKELLERPNIDILLNGVDNLSDNDITQLSLYILNKLRSVNANMTPKEIESRIRTYFTSDKDWDGRNFIGEEEGQIYVINSTKKKIKVSNFILIPKLTIIVDGGDKFHIYDVQVIGDPRTHKLMLRSRDFDDLKALQGEIAKQLSFTSSSINGCSSYMGDLAHKYITLADFEAEKLGTSLIGLERLEDEGAKYFCTPDAIYNMDGNVSEEIIYMGNQHSNVEELKNLTNLGYSKDEWMKTARVFLENAIGINEKVAMMSLLGWMGAIPHDYVIRKEVPTGFFPHCHIVGEPGSGKSTVMTLIKQFMGHNDASPRAFPTAFEVSKLLNSSYTIPIVLDEYGKRWEPERTNRINAILVESFTRSRWSRGTSNLSSVYFKYKNPILMGGQIPTDDQALATRIVPIRLYKAFQRSKNGQMAKTKLGKLQKLSNKNFWVGFNIWCAQHSNEDVEKVYITYRKHCDQFNLENRVADIYAIVMLGLHYMKRLAKELQVDAGYSDTDILDMAKQLDNSADAAETKDVSPLKDFFSDLASYATAIGNSRIHGQYFGKGLAVMPHTPTSVGAGEYGNARDGKEVACIFGQELILIKIKDVVALLNSRKRDNKFSEREIMTMVEGKFKEAQEDPTNGLVLAPKQFKVRSGMYSAFSKKQLCEMFPEFESIKWDR